MPLRIVEKWRVLLWRWLIVKNPPHLADYGGFAWSYSIVSLNNFDGMPCVFKTHFSFVLIFPRLRD